MLEKIPSGLGHALRGVRAGFEKIVSEDPDFIDVPDVLALQSHAFKDGGSIPARYTADGEKLSPPLLWTDVPAERRAWRSSWRIPTLPRPSRLCTWWRGTCRLTSRCCRRAS